MSHCVSPAPDDWIELWRHNAWGVYDSPDLALGARPPGQEAAFQLYAYELFPLAFVSGSAQPLDIPTTDVMPLDESFQSLGYDVVSRSAGHFFECSPLSCNGLAREESVNSHCLLVGLEAALDFGSRCEAAGSEPGPYYVVHVWRKTDGFARGA